MLKITLITTAVHNTANSIIRDVPVSSTVVEFADGTLAIIDTGMADGSNLVQELNNFGYAPEDFSLVLNTHLHCDHIGGNRLFSRARIIVSRRELAYENSFSRMLQDSKDPIVVLQKSGRSVDHLSPQLAQDLKQLAVEYPASSLVGNYRQIEYYEDEPLLPAEISLMQVPGHSIDSRAVQVQGGCQSLLAAGDALYHRDLWRGASVPGIHYNEKLFRRNAERIADFKGIIVPGHDRAFDNQSRQYLQNNCLFI